MATSIAKKTAPSNVRANVVINLIRTLTMTILSFITFPYVTRALGDQVFGLYTWANTFVYYFLIHDKSSVQTNKNDIEYKYLNPTKNKV